MSIKRGQGQVEFTGNESASMSDFFGYFKGLKENALDSITNLQNYLASIGVDDQVTQEFLGAGHGFLNDIDRFLSTINIIEGKAKGTLLRKKLEVAQEPQIATTPQEVIAAKKRIAQVSGEEDKEKDLDKKLKSTGEIKPGDKVHLTTMLERSESVGSQYDPVFLAEDIVRRTRGGNALGSPYQTCQEAYDNEIEKDKNISKKQKESVKAELANLGYPVK